MVSVFLLGFCILVNQAWSQANKVSVSVMKACCTYGQSHGAKGRSYTCKESEAVLPGILPYEKNICKSVWSSCCLNQKKSGICREGIRKAMENASCSGNGLCSEQQYCCSCCKIGLKVAVINQPCEFIKTSSGCDGISRTCCVQAKKNATLRALIDPKTVQKKATSCADTPCAHFCVDTTFGFECRCRTGFRLQGDLTSCEDIDECSLKRTVCNAGYVCINNLGSYRCVRDRSVIRCPKGREPDANRTKCIDIDECKKQPYLCGSNGECINLPGGYFCRCNKGYRFVADKGTCKDIDECKLGSQLCSHECQNTNGSYKCVCKAGYKLDYSQKNCIDINECVTSNPCHHECKNKVGSFECTCNAGYVLQADKINCVQARKGCSRNPCQWRCRDLPNGKYECLCPANYQLHSDGFSCLYKPSNPCANNRCQWRCERVGNSYRCLCPSGYLLQSDGRTCRNTCFNHRCEHRCEQYGNSYRCLCPSGYEVDTDGRSCKRIDPCLRNPCEYRCENLGGGRYRCSCPTGRELNTDGRTCRVKDVCENHDCQYRCQRVSSTRYRCVCPSGYEIQSDRRTCRDINECQRRSGLCDRRYYQCHNTLGAYRCIPTTCPKSYFRKITDRYCVKQQCPTGDAVCRRDVTYSYQWLASNVGNNVEVDGVEYYYTLSPPQYPAQVRFVIHSGNEDQAFYLRRQGQYRVLLKNRKKLVGPKDYAIQLYINIYRNGRLYTRLVNTFRIYVSAYEYY